MFDDDLKNDYDRTFDFLTSFIEFGVLLVKTLILIPLMIIFGLFLLSIPALVLYFGFATPILGSIYIFLVYGGVGAYSVHKYLNREGSRFDSEDGRQVYSDDDHIPDSSSLRSR